MMFTLNARARLTAALALAAILLVSALPTAPGLPLSHWSSAQLQVVVQQVKIHDDRDLLGGKGDMQLFVDIYRCQEGTPPSCGGRVHRAVRDLSASTGDTVTLDLLVGGEHGFVVYAGSAPHGEIQHP